MYNVGVYAKKPKTQEIPDMLNPQQQPKPPQPSKPVSHVKYGAPNQYAQEGQQQPKPLAWSEPSAPIEDVKRAYLPKPSPQEEQWKRVSDFYINAANKAKQQPQMAVDTINSPQPQQQPDYLNDWNAKAQIYINAANKNKAQKSNGALSSPNSLTVSPLAATSNTANTAQSLTASNEPTAVDVISNTANTGLSDASTDPELLRYYNEMAALKAQAEKDYGAGAFGDGFDTSKLDNFAKLDYNNKFKGYSDVKNKHDEVSKNIDTEKQNSFDRQRQEYVNQELFKKYLPTFLKAQGLGGLGVSQSTLTELESDYRNRVSSIESESNKAIREYMRHFGVDYDSVFGANGSVTQEKNRIDGEKTKVDQALALTNYEDERKKILPTNIDGIDYYTPGQIAELEKLYAKYSSKLSYDNQIALSTEINTKKSITNDFMNNDNTENIKKDGGMNVFEMIGSLLTGGKSRNISAKDYKNGDVVERDGKKYACFDGKWYQINL